mgnify:CR=1 FL=1
MPKTNKRYATRKRSDGLYEVYMPLYPSVCIPESIGDKSHAEQYLASEYAMTVKEYKKYINGANKRKVCPNCGYAL